MDILILALIMILLVVNLFILNNLRAGVKSLKAGAVELNSSLYFVQKVQNNLIDFLKNCESQLGSMSKINNDLHLEKKDIEKIKLTKEWDKDY